MQEWGLLKKISQYKKGFNEFLVLSFCENEVDLDPNLDFFVCFRIYAQLLQIYYLGIWHDTWTLKETLWNCSDFSLELPREKTAKSYFIVKSIVWY